METELPTSLTDWINLAWQLFLIFAAVAGFVWKFLKQPIEAKITAAAVGTEHTINGLGSRVNIIETSCSAHSSEIDKHDRAIERVEGAVVQNRERMSRMEGAVERLVSAIERNRDAHAEEDSEIRERLVRIETKVDSLHQQGHH